MKKLLLASVLMSALSAFAASSDQLSKTQSTLQQSPPLITESNRENFERAHRQAVDNDIKEITPINCSVNSTITNTTNKDTQLNFNVSAELYKDSKDNKKEFIYNIKSLTSNAGKVEFGNTQSHSYISKATREVQTNVNQQESDVENQQQKSKLILTPAQLNTGFIAYLSPKFQGDKATVELCFTNVELVSIKDFTVDGTTIQLPKSNSYGILTTIAIELNKPTIVELKDGLKMSVMINKI